MVCARALCRRRHHLLNASGARGFRHTDIQDGLRRLIGQDADMEPTEITAGRLHLRPYVEADIDAVYACCQDPDIQRWTTVPVPYTRAHAQGYVEQHTAEGWRAGAGNSFAVVDSVGNTLLASVGLVRADLDARIAEIGYWANPDARGKGVTTQAVQVVSRWAFDELGIERMEWVAAVGNDASRRVAEKAGFTVEGVLRSRIMHRDGSREDAWIGSLLPGDLP
jgi:RimJ/RimL family protein N-acetyltransferase